MYDEFASPDAELVVHVNCIILGVFVFLKDTSLVFRMSPSSFHSTQHDIRLLSGLETMRELKSTVCCAPEPQKNRRGYGTR